MSRSNNYENIAPAESTGTNNRSITPDPAWASPPSEDPARPQSSPLTLTALEVGNAFQQLSVVNKSKLVEIEKTPERKALRHRQEEQDAFVLPLKFCASLWADCKLGVEQRMQQLFPLQGLPPILDFAGQERQAYHEGKKILHARAKLAKTKEVQSQLEVAAKPKPRGLTAEEAIIANKLRMAEKEAKKVAASASASSRSVLAAKPVLQQAATAKLVTHEAAATKPDLRTAADVAAYKERRNSIYNIKAPVSGGAASAMSARRTEKHDASASRIVGEPMQQGVAARAALDTPEALAAYQARRAAIYAQAPAPRSTPADIKKPLRL